MSDLSGDFDLHKYGYRRKSDQLVDIGDLTVLFFFVADIDMR
jgi:hypothetical protein